ncbi:hypothetical protein B0H10DRAFT_1710662, partial [Mycena sp. CBHHK59/15]
WFKVLYAEVSLKNLGGSFNSLLALFVEIERAYKWEKSKGKGLGATNRPAQVGAWVTAGRGTRRGPRYPLVAVYDAAWWQWWGDLQPQWRVADGGKPRRFSREVCLGVAKEHWVTLRHPGPNGVLSLVASLYWWGAKVAVAGKTEDKESWAEAVQDVKWM